jgi:hypothetical protein
MQISLEQVCPVDLPEEDVKRIAIRTIPKFFLFYEFAKERKKRNELHE